MADSNSKPSFQLPPIHINGGGWGPVSDVIPTQFRDIPYAPYSKGDKLGRVADWTNQDSQKQESRETSGGRQGGGRINRFNREQHQVYGAAFASAFAYTHTEDESSFSVVDNRSAAAKKMALKAASGQRARAMQSKQTTTARSQNQRVSSSAASKQQQQQQNRRKYGYKDYDKPQRVRNASITIGPDWKVLDEIEFNRLGKLTFGIPEAEDVATFGSVNYYNKAFDRVNTKNEKMLQHVEKVKYDYTASEDPILQKFLEEDKATIVATDDVLALLMCTTRTVFPWDIVVKKVGDKVILDKRYGGVFDYVTVNENSAEPPIESEKDTINSLSALSSEATYINQHFSRQVLDSEKVHKFEQPNPFATEDEKDKLASCGYRYRKFNLTGSSEATEGEEEERIYLIVRTEVDAAIKLGNQDPTFMTVRALNEYDPNAQGNLPWKKSLDSQRGAVVAAEMKNNAAKLARWAVQAMLAGADQLKLGYVSRLDYKNNTRHVILGTQAYKPRDFAAQMNLSLTNGWGIVKAVIDMCLQLPEGRYVLMKDPNRPILRIYSIPSDEDLEEKEEEEEEQPDQEEGAEGEEAEGEGAPSEAATTEEKEKQ